MRLIISWYEPLGRLRPRSGIGSTFGSPFGNVKPISLGGLLCQEWMNGHDRKLCLVSSVCTRGMSYRGRERGLLTCYPNTSLTMAKELMEAKALSNYQWLIVVEIAVERGSEESLIFLIMMHALWHCLRFILLSDTCLYNNICFPAQH